MVPFTWLIVSWTLSFANQATAAVLAIPMGAISQMQTDTANANGNNGLFHDQVIPTKLLINFGTDNPGSDASAQCNVSTGKQGD